jgi:hypothetical protein
MGMNDPEPVCAACVLHILEIGSNSHNEILYVQVIPSGSFLVIMKSESDLTTIFPTERFMSFDTIRIYKRVRITRGDDQWIFEKRRFLSYPFPSAV